jgi:hypothetical protein
MTEAGNSLGFGEALSPQHVSQPVWQYGTADRLGNEIRRADPISAFDRLDIVQDRSPPRSGCCAPPASPGLPCIQYGDTDLEVDWAVFHQKTNPQPEPRHDARNTLLHTV